MCNHQGPESPAGPTYFLLGSVGLGAPTEIEKLPEGRTYAAKGEVELSVVAWKVGDVYYALAATSISIELLIEIAKLVK